MKNIPEIDWTRVDALIRMALDEDLGDRGDTTTISVIDASLHVEAVFLAKEDCVCAGLCVAERLMKTVDPSIEWKSCVKEGDFCPKGTILARVKGPARSLLTGDPSIGALYSVNLRCSLLRAQMVKELGLEGRIRLTGSDLCPESALYLKKGVLNAILFRDPALQARQGTKRLTDFLLHGIKPPSKSEIIRSTLILKSNLEQYL